MLLQLFRNDKNNNVGEIKFTPQWYWLCNSKGHCEVHWKITKIPINIWCFTGWLMGPLCGLSLRCGSDCPARNGKYTEIWDSKYSITLLNFSTLPKIWFIEDTSDRDRTWNSCSCNFPCRAFSASCSTSALIVTRPCMHQQHFSINTLIIKNNTSHHNMLPFRIPMTHDARSRNWHHESTPFSGTGFGTCVTQI